MQLYVDNLPIPCDAGSLASALGQAAAHAEQQGRIVVEVILDGRRLGDDELDAIGSMPLPTEVRVITTTPAALLGETFEQAAVVVEGIGTNQQEAATLLQSGRRVEAMSVLESALRNWDEVRTAVDQGVQLARSGMAELSVNSTELESSLTLLATSLRELRDAMLQRDEVRLSDCLLYEMPATVKQWRELLSSLGERARLSEHD